MKQLLSILVPIIIMMALIVNQALPASAAKKAAKKKGVSQEKIDEMSNKANKLIEKLYERELYTPEDSKQLIALKIELDDQMDIMPEVSLAPIYFKVAKIYKMRNKEKEAIDCYKTILENFSETAYGPKSRDILEEMGVKIKLPQASDEEENKEEM